MRKPQFINPAAIAAPPGNFSWLAQSDNIIWLAGMVALDKSGKLVGAGNAELQTRQIYENVEAALKDRGGDLNCLVKTVTYVVGRENIAGMRRVRAGLRQSGRMTNMPPSTLLLVAGLAEEDFLVEMDAMAVIA